MAECIQELREIMADINRLDLNKDENVHPNKLAMRLSIYPSNSELIIDGTVDAKTPTVMFA